MLGWEFPPFVSGGLGVHCFELTRALGNKGVTVDFFMPKTSKQVISPHPNVNIIEVSEASLSPYLVRPKKGDLTVYGFNLNIAVEKYNRELAALVVQYHQQRNYSFVHGHDWLTMNGGSAVKKATGLPWAQTIHSTEYDRTSWPWDFILDIERMGCREADMLITVSKRMREQLIGRFGTNPRKVRVVYNGVDAARFEARDLDGKSYAQIKRGKKVVLFLGRLTSQKGPVQFIHAAKRVLEKTKDVQFVIAGTGDMLPLLINLTIQLGISGSFTFLGYINEEEQKRIYAVADVYVMPSVSEPFGITALEAMAAGTPVILSRSSGVGEAVKTALRVDFWDITGMAERILAVLKYPPLGKVMGKHERFEAQFFNWNRTADETLVAYRELEAMKSTTMAVR